MKIKEWSDIDDISHVYGPSIENETIDQYLKISNDDGEIILNIPLTIEEIKNNFLNIIEDINHSGEKDLAEIFYFFGQSGEKGEWENLDNLIEVNEFKASEFSVHVANLDGLKIIYAISYKKEEKVFLSVESSNPNYQNFEVRMGEDV